MSCSLFLTFRCCVSVPGFWFLSEIYFLCLCLFAVVAGEHQVEPAARGLHLLRLSGETNRSIGRGGRFVISYIPHTHVKYIPFKCPHSQKAAVLSYPLTLWAGGSRCYPTPSHSEQGGRRLILTSPLWAGGSCLFLLPPIVSRGAAV